jgi:hypothetical protein
MCHLFERRMGGELYVPWGLDYYKQGYWGVVDANKDAVAQQFLINMFVDDSLQKITDRQDGTILVDTNDGKLPYKGIDFNTFCKTKFDIIISTVPAHIPVYMKLLKDHQPQAKFIFEAGNNWGHIPINVPNFLNSTTYTFISGEDMHGWTMNSLYKKFSKRDLYKGMHKVFQNRRSGKKCNMVFFHPEFDLNIFKNDNSIKDIKSISNIRHGCNTLGGLYELERRLPDWTVKAYGVANRDGELKTDYDIARVMNESGFIYHVKPVGDGYGYNVHQTYAVGSILITDSTHMCSGGNPEEWFTSQLLLDTENYHDKPAFVDWSRYNYDALVDRLKWCADNYPVLQENARNKFKEVVDFDAEYQKVRVFIERLI